MTPPTRPQDGRGAPEGVGVVSAYSDEWLTIHGGDCRDVLATLPAESVHCVVTSPPYWGLRDYGTATWDGGDAGCDHKPPSARRGVERRASTLGGGVATITAQDSGRNAKQECPRCGAIRQDRQLGLEPTPEEYVANMVAVFREVRRVLRDDGTLWLNLGDSYAATTKGSGGTKSKQPTNAGSFYAARFDLGSVKPKDLVGIPWRVAFALQADGWYLRSEVIWSKPNPMPESVTDRPTKAHEQVFLLTKSSRYWYDADAVREPISESTERIHGSERVRAKGNGEWKMEGNGDRNDGDSATLINGPARLAKMQAAGGRNRRTVWTIATQPYPGAHFAVMPEALVEPCVLAGCPEGGTVLDPFGGSGTVARVANRLSRRAVLIDLNPDYLEQQMARNRDIPLGLTA